MSAEGEGGLWVSGSLVFVVISNLFWKKHGLQSQTWTQIPLYLLHTLCDLRESPGLSEPTSITWGDEPEPSGPLCYRTEWVPVLSTVHSK